jgi:hypothetical protein
MSDINNGFNSPNSDLINQLLPMLFKSLEGLLEDCSRLIEYIPESEQSNCVELLAKIQDLNSKLPHISSIDGSIIEAKDFIVELEGKLALLADRALDLEPLMNSDDSVKTYFSLLAHELKHVRKSVDEILRLY